LTADSKVSMRAVEMVDQTDGWDARKADEKAG